MRAPIHPLSPDAISIVVRRRLNRLGITDKRRGPHALRHAAAQHLLDHGLSMKEVGDYLGHRRISSTSVYAKVQFGHPPRGRRHRPGGPGMILRDAINDYSAWRQAHGAKFHSSASVLHCFCKHVGGNIGCDAVAEADRSRLPCR